MLQSVVISGRPHATLDGICAPFGKDLNFSGCIHVVYPLRPGVIQMSEHQGFGELKKPPNPASCADALTHARARRKTRIEFARLYRTHACIARARALHARMARTYCTHAHAHTRALLCLACQGGGGGKQRGAVYGCQTHPDSPKSTWKNCPHSTLPAEKPCAPRGVRMAASNQCSPARQVLQRMRVAVRGEGYLHLRASELFA